MGEITRGTRKPPPEGRCTPKPSITYPLIHARKLYKAQVVHELLNEEKALATSRTFVCCAVGCASRGRCNELVFALRRELEMDETLEMQFVLSAVDRALSVATSTIWNSDQGSHFASPAYLSRLQTAHVAISMDGRGRVTDNIFIERLWRSVKVITFRP